MEAAAVSADRAVVQPPAGRGGASGPHTTDFEYGKDWTVVAGGRGAPPLEQFEAAGNLVFAGNGYVINKTNVNPFEGLDVKGKIVVVAGLPPQLAAQAGSSPRAVRGAPNPLGENCTDYLTPEEAAAKNGAVAVVRVATFQRRMAAA